MAGPLTRWDPFAEFAELQTRLDRVFEDLTSGRGQRWTPAIDLVRKKNSLVLRADIPGITPDEVKIEVNDDVLTVSGEHEEIEEEKEDDERFVRRERRYGSFVRSIPLPPGVDAKKIKAKTRHGVLEVTVPLPKDSEKKSVQITPTAED